MEYMIWIMNKSVKSCSSASAQISSNVMLQSFHPAVFDITLGQSQVNLLDDGAK